MKKCQACGKENADQMNFCLECGKPLASASQDWPSTDSPTVAFNENPTTARQGSFETQSIPRGFTSPQVPRSRGKIFAVIGGVAALVLLVFGGFAAVIGYWVLSVDHKDPPPPYGNQNNAPVNKPGVSPSPVASKSPTANPQFTPPVEATKTGTFTVYANTGWQLSDIDTIAKETFRTKIEGKVDLDGVKTGLTPKGVTDESSKSRRIYPEFPTGALLMRTKYADGKFSNVMAMASNGATGTWTNFPDEQGKIEFCINDNAPEKNGGQFTVTVTMSSVPKAKK